VTVVEDPPIAFERTGDVRSLASSRRDRVRFAFAPRGAYLAIDGSDVPGSGPYLEAMETIFRAAYRLHVILGARGVDEPVGMPEALYWLPAEALVGNGTTGASEIPDWHWRLLLAVPPEAGEDEVDAACRAVEPGPMRDRLYLERWAEGPCAQILHVGAYGSEGPALRRLHDAVERAGLRVVGPLHEIYLNDPHRVGEEHARTILRRAVEPA